MSRASSKMGPSIGNSVGAALERKNPSVELLLQNPREVYAALTGNANVITWLERISNHYIPPNASVNLLYPCTAKKPFLSSQSYRQLMKTMEKLGENKQRIHLFTISEPFGAIPLELAAEVPSYDCPGLFRWWCSQNSQPFDKEYLDRSIEIIAEHTARLLKKLRGKSLALVRTFSSSLKHRDDHTHYRILTRARDLSGASLSIIPTKQTVKKIVETRGRLAWDRYGPAHPLAQQSLLRRLRAMLNET